MNQIWFSDAVWRTSESPEFKPGFIACASFGVVLILTCLLMRWLEVRDEKSRGYDANEGAEGKETGRRSDKLLEKGEAEIV